MKLWELDRVLSATYTIRMCNLLDMHEFIERNIKITNPDKYSISFIEQVTESIPELNVISKDLEISRRFDWNSIKDLKVLEITDNFIVYVGYEGYH